MSADGSTLHAEHAADRKKYTDAILESDAQRKVIAAGPGTGKTFLFGELCKKTDGDNLVLSFINELVNDIRKDIGDIADVRTLHSFAGRYLRSRFYMKLTELIEADYTLVTGKKASFKKIFSCLLPGFDEEMAFYSNRRKYYNYFGPYCSVYALVKAFDSNPGKIPTFSLVLIDEFQDFNKLETRLIDQLASKSPIVIAGDDDQSLYSFKYADPEEIRLRMRSGEYVPFELPYCSRCPEILVAATNKLTEIAQRNNCLTGRVDKTYKYFRSKEKDVISQKYQKIVIRQNVYHSQVASYLNYAIQDIVCNDRDANILIICTLAKQIKPLANALRKKGFTNIETPLDRLDLTKNEAYNLLLEDEKDNLAWRILAEHMFSEAGLTALVKCSVTEGKAIHEFFDPDKKKIVVNILRILRKVEVGRSLTEIEASALFKEFEIDPVVASIEKVKEAVLNNEATGSSRKSTPVKIVTMTGAKGLTRDYVFVVNYDDRFIIDKDGKISDENICKFLVALTRAKKKLTIFTSGNKPPVFLRWVGPDFYITS